MVEKDDSRALDRERVDRDKRQVKHEVEQGAVEEDQEVLPSGQVVEVEGI